MMDMKTLKMLLGLCIAIGAISLIMLIAHPRRVNCNSESEEEMEIVTDIRFDMLSEAKLFVNGTEIENKYGTYLDVDSGEAFIPFTTVLSALDVDLFWNSIDWAFFEIGNVSFEIGTNDKILSMRYGEHNFIENCRAVSKDDELMICHTDVADMLEYLLHAEVSVDTEKSEVYIDEFDAESQNCFKKGTLLINGEKIDTFSDVLIDINYDFAVIPFVEVAEHLGATFEFEVPDKIILKYGSKNYYIYGTSIVCDDGFDEEEAPGGYGKYGYYRAIGRDFLIDTNYIKQFFGKVMHTSIIVDCDSMTVKLTQTD